MTAKRLKKLATKAVKYTNALGAKYGAETAQKVGEEIERLIASGVQITPEALLEQARKEDSVLHPLFTWDNDEAAEKYRLWEARSIINHLRIVTINPRSGEEQQRNAFFSLRVEPEEAESTEQRQYFHLTQVMSDEQKRQQVLEMAQREVKGWAEKYAHFGFTELQPLISAILGK